MTGAAESDYVSAFEGLLVDEGLVDPQVFAQVDTYDEIPLYSRLSQIGFLKDLSIADQNRELIRATVRHLDHLAEYFLSRPEGGQVLRLVSITGWWVDGDLGGTCTDGTTELIRPHLWIGNIGNKKMIDFRLYRPQSRCASFVMSAVDQVEHGVFESRLKETALWCPRRVYVGRSGELPAALLS